MAVLNRIGDIENRAQSIEEFLQSTENTSARKHALDMLIELVPRIPDSRNWQSGALATIVHEYVALDETNEALRVARSVQQKNFRANALINVADGMLRAREFDQAEQIAREALAVRPEGGADLARLLAGIARESNRPALNLEAADLLERAIVVARREQFVPAVYVGGVMEGWAELGDTTKCIELANTIPIDFYKDQAFEPMTSAIAAW